MENENKKNTYFTTVVDLLPGDSVVRPGERGESRGESIEIG
jgi:hypothetical protein